MKHATFLYEMTKANVKLQNENSILGFVWYLLGPFLLFLIMLFVFSDRLGANIEQYPLYLFMGIISWNFFATGTGRSMTAITGNAALIKAIPIRTELLVVSAVLHALISHTAEIVLFVGILFWMGITPALIGLYAFVLFLAFLFTLGTGLFLAACYVFLRDVQQIWSVLTRAWWFATPIFYAATETGPGSKLSLINPLYYHIHLSRELLIYGRIPDVRFFLSFLAFALAALVCGYGMFRILQPRFASLL